MNTALYRIQNFALINMYDKDKTYVILKKHKLNIKKDKNFEN